VRHSANSADEDTVRTDDEREPVFDPSWWIRIADLGLVSFTVQLGQLLTRNLER
jgi:hypothetical protein